MAMALTFGVPRRVVREQRENATSGRQRLDDPYWLRKRYVDDGASDEEIAAECQCSRNAVRGARRRAAIQSRPAGRPPKIAAEPDDEGDEFVTLDGWLKAVRSAIGNPEALEDALIDLGLVVAIQFGAV